MNVKYNNLATQRYYKVTISDTNKTLSIYLIFSSRTVPFTYWALQQNKCNCLCFHRPGFLSLILFKGDYFYNGLFLMILGYQSIKCRYYVNANCFHNIIYCDSLKVWHSLFMHLRPFNSKENLKSFFSSLNWTL